MVMPHVIFLVVFILCCGEVNSFSFISLLESPRSSRSLSARPLFASIEKQTPVTVQCKFCDSAFASRNALFRHIKSSPSCSKMANLQTAVEIQRHVLALQFSYWDKTTTIGKTISAASCGLRLKEAVYQSIQLYLDGVLKMSSDNNEVITAVGWSQSTVSRLRHSSLQQEDACLAVGDTMAISFDGPSRLTSVPSGNTVDQEAQQKDFLQFLLNSTNDILRMDEAAQIQLEGCKLLSTRDNRFHCERSCTQRVYHYLMPITWLPNGDLLEQWWLQCSSAPQSNDGNHTNRATERPPSEALRRMKQLLRQVESEQLGKIYNKEEADSLNIRSAAGRFGTLGTKQRVAWHNFADPTLQGDASPNTEPVWRVLDRARIHQLLISNNDDGDDEKVVALLEFRGDEFLPQQIRRIVGTTLAMAHAWLPEDTLDIATRADMFLQTPLAPAGRLYLVENRFHFDEMRSGGKGIFETHVDGISLMQSKLSEGIDDIQSHIFNKCARDKVRQQEQDWLEQLRREVSPRISKQIDSWRKSVELSHLVAPTKAVVLHGNQKPYQKTLDLLREIIDEEKWPETSVARSSVIGNVDKRSRQKMQINGSFSVVNPCFANGLYKDGVGNDRLPLGNDLFPELVKAVFELEIELSKTGIKQAEGTDAVRPRPVSSHCAINCNAQFTPHVDSGRGAGQSLSMIVGLGDYAGGELGVEGIGHDIRYAPLEFDGWRLRHWTKPFVGERFSLVWFTPELKGDA